ncbi:VC0807 family protein, partial [Fodinicola feengrottensis]|uniref:VC0807 family protein n=1 Tax=Fodinicola feengrottensis TaxID=435914 RepID=UPI0024418157
MGAGSRRSGVVRIVWGIVRNRKLNGIALFTISMMVVGNAISLLTGDPRLLLAKEAWMTMVVGLWMLSSLFARQPVIFTGAKLMMPSQQARDDWEESWTHPEFRHVMRVGTVIWVVLLFADTAVRVVMAYTLPVDQVPVLNVVTWIVLIAAMQVCVRAYGKNLCTRDTPSRWSAR